MGLSPHSYFCMSPLEFSYAAKGYVNKQWKQWEHTRFLGYQTAASVKRKTALPPMERWLKLPTDDTDISEDRIKQMFDKLKDAKRT